MTENRKCPSCGQRLPEQHGFARVSDADLLAALAHPASDRKRPSRPWLYASAGPNRRGVDRSRWYVTGPQDRLGYLKGPFPRDQVARLERAGAISAEVREADGLPSAYVLTERTQPVLPSQRGGFARMAEL